MKILPCLIAVPGLLVGGAVPGAADTLDPRTVLEEARAATAAGRYEEALEKQIWFHENALEARPDLAGVRLSFALGYWMDLAEKYPTAGEALREIRDRQEAELANGERSYHDFVDVASINEVLGDEDRTIRLFRKLDREAPDFARQVYRIVGDTLVEAGDHALSRKYLGDLDAVFDELRQMHEMNGQLARENPDLDTEPFRRHREEKFRNDVARTVEVLVATGDEDKALNFYEKALEVTPEEEALRTRVREAVARGRRAASGR